jgi:hypothetical protein
MPSGTISDTTWAGADTVQRISQPNRPLGAEAGRLLKTKDCVFGVEDGDRTPANRPDERI